MYPRAAEPGAGSLRHCADRHEDASAHRRPGRLQADTFATPSPPGCASTPVFWSRPPRQPPCLEGPQRSAMFSMGTPLSLMIDTN